MNACVANDIEMTVNNIEVEKIDETLGIDLCTMPDAYTIQVLRIRHKRHHKKKRINKKWLKKYGYCSTYSEVKGWKMQTYVDGRVEFIKD